MRNTDEEIEILSEIFKDSYPDSVVQQAYSPPGVEKKDISSTELNKLPRRLKFVGDGWIPASRQ